MSKNYVSGLTSIIFGVSAIGLLAFFPLKSVTAVFGYGYGCDESYGYGYSCDGETVKDDNGEIVKDEKSESKKYKKLKKKYKNKSVKGVYKEIKHLKKGTDLDKQRYNELKVLYKQYKHLSKSERREILTPAQYEEFKIYKRYKGYKEYKQLRKDMGL